MAILSQVTKQIKALLPFYTDHYSESTEIFDYSYTVVEVDGEPQERLTFEVMENTDLRKGDFIVVDGVRPLFPVLDAQYDTLTGILYLKLNKYHQIFSYDTNITLKGFQPDEFNGEFPLISVIQEDVQVQLPTGLFLNPFSGEPKYVSKNLVDYVNGYHELILDPPPTGNILTVNYYVIKDSLLDLTDAVIKTSRVSAMVDTDKFLSTITSDKVYKNNYWVYTTLSETDIDLTSVEESNYLSGVARTFVYDIISVYACQPIMDGTGLEAVEILRDEIFRAINKCILFYFKPTVQFWDTESRNWVDGEGNVFNINSIEMFLADNVKVIYRYNYVYGSQIVETDGFDIFEERRWKYFYVDVNGEEGSEKL